MSRAEPRGVAGSVRGERLSTARPLAPVPSAPRPVLPGHECSCSWLPGPTCACLCLSVLPVPPSMPVLLGSACPACPCLPSCTPWTSNPQPLPLVLFIAGRELMDICWGLYPLAGYIPFIC